MAVAFYIPPGIYEYSSCYVFFLLFIYTIFFIYFIHFNRYIVIFDFDLICILLITNDLGASLVTQRVKKLLAVRDTKVRSLSWEDPL